ncbi:MAG: hypothetical protein ACE5E5_10375 [Phycisphaerae bacterium]
MAATVNRIKNPSFSLGKSDPRHWLWTCEGANAQFERLPAKSKSGGSGGVAIAIADRAGSASFSQIANVKPGEHYRLEATVSCDLAVGDASGGVVLSVTAAGDQPIEKRATPPMRRVDQPTAIRTYFTAPEGVHQVTLTIGVHSAQGEARVFDVRFIRILELDLDGHALAVPPPAFAVAPPRTVKSVCVCSTSAASRPMTDLLRQHFGSAQVETASPNDITRASVTTDAVIFPDDTLPRRIHSLGALRLLARDRIVIVSLPAFATVAPLDLRWRLIDQDDDPIHAKVAFANFATSGFALDDVFPYAWPGRAPDGFAQRQFKMTTAFKSFCKKHRFDTLLNSMCDNDRTSDRPIALISTYDRGALIVLDTDPAETPASTFGEPQLAVHLLLSALGQQVTGLGQFCVPYDRNGLFRGALREMQTRFSNVAVHDADLPNDEVDRQIITLGREDQSFGLPLTPKPTLILRSGLTAGDMESVYGCLLWLKQLVRMAPHECPYVEALASRFRIAWIPCAATWEPRAGFEASHQPPDCETQVDLDPDCTASVIDVASCAANRIRVVLPDGGETYARYTRWLPRLAETFAAGFGLIHQPEPGEGYSDRAGFTWRTDTPSVAIEIEPAAFRSQARTDVLSRGGRVVRIEIPGSSADFVARSIHRTHLAATMVELVIGLEYGLIAVNRRSANVRFDGFAPLAPGEALIVDDPEKLRKAKAS